MISFVENYGKYLGLATWGLLILIMIPFIISGFIKGRKKSLYYMIVDIILLIFVCACTAIISIKWFIKPDNFYNVLIKYLNKYGASNVIYEYGDYLELLKDPNIASFVLGLLDIVFKLLLFFILLPIVRIILKLSIAVPLWEKKFKKKIIANQKPKIEADIKKYNQKHKKQIAYNPKYDKKIKHKYGGRMLGALYGAATGLISALVVLVPVFFLIGSIRNINFDNLSASNTNPNVEALAENSDYEYSITLDDDIIAILQLVQANANNGANDLYLTLDDELFNLLFNVKLNDGKTFSLGNDIRSLTSALGIIVDNNFLDLKNVNIESKEEIDLLFNKLANMTLITDVIPALLNIGLSKPEILALVSNEIAAILTPELLNDPVVKTYLNVLLNFDFSKELLVYKDMLLELLNYDNLAALINLKNIDFVYLKDESVSFESKLAYLDSYHFNDLATHVINALREFNNSQILDFLGLACYMLPEFVDLSSFITWESDANSYIREKLDFIISNTHYLNENGENSQYNHLIDLLSNFLGENEASELILEAYLTGDYFSLIDERLNEVVDKTLTTLTTSDLIMNLVPIGFDYMFYTLSDESFETQINDYLNTINLGSEIYNIGSIYSDISNIAFSYFTEYGVYPFIDYILQNHSANINAVTHKLLVDSHFISNIAYFYLLANYEVLVEDVELREAVYYILTNTVDFNNTLGSDIASIIDSLLLLAPNLSVATFFEDGGMLQILYALSQVDSSGFDEINDSLSNLSFIENIEPLIRYVATLIPDIAAMIDYPVVNSYSSLLYNALGLAYYALREVVSQDIDYNELFSLNFDYIMANVDVVKILKNSHIQSILTTDLGFYELNQIIASYLMNNELPFISIPEILKDKEIYSTDWNNEILSIFKSIFILKDQDLIANFSTINSFINYYDTLSSALFSDTLFLENTTFVDDLLSSRIIRYTVSNYLTSSVESLDGLIFIPESLLDNEGIIDKTKLTASIKALVNFINKLYEENESITSLLDIKSNYWDIIARFNALNDSDLNTLGNDVLLNTFIKENLNNEDLGIAISQMVVGLSNFPFENNLLKMRGLTSTELYRLLKALKDFSICKDLVETVKENPLPLINSVSDAKIDSIYNSNIIRCIIDNVFYDPAIKAYASTYLNSIAFFSSNNINSEELLLNPLYTYTKDGDNRLRKIWLKDVFGLIQSLEFNTLEEIYELNNYEAIKTKLYSSTFFNEVSTNTFIIDIFSVVLLSVDTNHLMVDYLNNYLASAGYEVEFSYNFINFNNPLYDISSQDRVKGVELEKFIRAIFEIDYPSLMENSSEEASMLSKIVDISNMMFNESYNDPSVSILDYLLNSNIVYAIFDIVLNLSSDRETASLINTFLSALLPSDLNFGTEILEINEDAFDTNGLLKKYEIENLFRIFSVINPDSTSALEMVYSLDDSNLEYDGVYYIGESIYMMSIITNILNSNGLKEYIIGLSGIDLPTTILDLHPLMLRENGLLKTLELRNVLIACKIIGFENGLEGYNISMIMNLIGANEVDGTDDLDRIINTNYIYLILARLLESDYVASQFADLLSSNNTNFEIVPDDAKSSDDTSIEYGYLKRVELRAVFDSLHVLGVVDSTSFNSIKIAMFEALLDRYLYASLPNDDLDLFLESIIMWNVMSNSFISSDMIDSIARGHFDINDLIILDAAYDEVINTRLSKLEIRRLLYATRIIENAITEQPEIDIDLFASMSDIEFNIILDSYYMYSIISLVLISNDNVSFPEDSYDTNISSPYYPLLLRSELENLKEALNILGSLDHLNEEDLSISVLYSLLSLNDNNGSPVIEQKLSDFFIEYLTSFDLPTRALTNIDIYDLIRIKHNELVTLVDVLYLINGNNDTNLAAANTGFEEIIMNSDYTLFSDIAAYADVLNDGSYIMLRVLSQSIQNANLLTNNNFAYVISGYSEYGDAGIDLWFEEIMGLADFMETYQIELSYIEEYITSATSDTLMSMLPEVLATRAHSIIATKIASKLGLDVDYEENIINQCREILFMSSLDNSNDSILYYDNDGNLIVINE